MADLLMIIRGTSERSVRPTLGEAIVLAGQTGYYLKRMRYACFVELRRHTVPRRRRPVTARRGLIRVKGVHHAQ
jgi:hypothetical protein